MKEEKRRPKAEGGRQACSASRSSSHSLPPVKKGETKSAVSSSLFSRPKSETQPTKLIKSCPQSSFSSSCSSSKTTAWTCRADKQAALERVRAAQQLGKQRSGASACKKEGDLRALSAVKKPRSRKTRRRKGKGSRRRRRPTAAQRAAGRATLLREVRLSPLLREIVFAVYSEKRHEAGELRMSRPQVTQCIWQYAKTQNLPREGDGRTVCCDERLRNLFGGREKVDLFRELQSLLVPHLLFYEEGDYADSTQGLAEGEDSGDEEGDSGDEEGDSGDEEERGRTAGGSGGFSDSSETSSDSSSEGSSGDEDSDTEKSEEVNEDKGRSGTGKKTQGRGEHEESGEKEARDSARRGVGTSGRDEGRAGEQTGTARRRRLLRCDSSSSDNDSSNESSTERRQERVRLSASSSSPSSSSRSSSASSSSFSSSSSSSSASSSFSSSSSSSSSSSPSFSSNRWGREVGEGGEDAEERRRRIRLAVSAAVSSAGESGGVWSSRVGHQTGVSRQVAVPPLPPRAEAGEGRLRGEGGGAENSIFVADNVVRVEHPRQPASAGEADALQRDTRDAGERGDRGERGERGERRDRRDDRRDRDGGSTDAFAAAEEERRGSDRGTSRSDTGRVKRRRREGDGLISSSESSANERRKRTRSGGDASSGEDSSCDSLGRLFPGRGRRQKFSELPRKSEEDPQKCLSPSRSASPSPPRPLSSAGGATSLSVSIPSEDSGVYIHLTAITATSVAPAFEVRPSRRVAAAFLDGRLSFQLQFFPVFPVKTKGGGEGEGQTLSRGECAKSEVASCEAEIAYSELARRETEAAANSGALSPAGGLVSSRVRTAQGRARNEKEEPEERGAPAKNPVKYLPVDATLDRAPETGRLRLRGVCRVGELEPGLAYRFTLQALKRTRTKREGRESQASNGTPSSSSSSAFSLSAHDLADAVLMQRQSPALWGVSEVSLFLQSLLVPGLAAAGEACGLDGLGVMELREEDLTSLGVHAPFLRRRVLEALRKLKADLARVKAKADGEDEEPRSPHPG
ncbi:UNVERIFIED_CONTAM: SWIB/MDM2 domain-containing protein [Hammondia hammondi]|eukprot:XP_008885629.1 SWIB/MDM2 domain-containing protein [Hammondia hammondi]